MEQIEHTHPCPICDAIQTCNDPDCDELDVYCSVCLDAELAALTALTPNYYSDEDLPL
jgi:hypothetical protein